MSYFLVFRLLRLRMPELQPNFDETENIALDSSELRNFFVRVTGHCGLEKFLCFVFKARGFTARSLLHFLI